MLEFCRKGWLRQEHKPAAMPQCLAAAVLPAMGAEHPVCSLALPTQLQPAVPCTRQHGHRLWEDEPRGAKTPMLVLHL